VSSGIEQLSPLLGDWVADSKAFSEGRGHTTVTLTEDGKLLRIHSVEEDQRYIGKLSDDGRSITGRWEFSEDGKSWKVDFDLNYTKAAGGHS